MNTIQSSRGPFVVCTACMAYLKEAGLVDRNGKPVSDSISDEFCPNCYDRNKILIDDLAGSTE